MAVLYRNEIEKKHIEKINNILLQMPSFVTSYIQHIQFSTTAQTRLGYLTDILLFFEYIVDADTGFAHEKVSDISLSCLEGLDLDFYNSYLGYLTYYEKNGTLRSNDRVSIRRKLSSLRNFYSFLYLNDYISVNIVQKIKIPKVQNKELIRMNKEETEEFIATVEYGNGKLSKKEQDYFDKYSLRDYIIITLLLSSGIRVSELVGLDINDVDLKHSGMRIIRKGGKEDVVYFNDAVTNQLRDYLVYRKSITTISGHEQALFLSSQRRRISVRSVEILVKKYSSRTELLKKITPHKLRSTYGTALYEETGDLYLVAEVLGHSSVETTRKHYTEVTKQRKHENRNAVDFLSK